MKILAGKTVMVSALMGALLIGCDTAPDSMRGVLDRVGEHRGGGGGGGGGGGESLTVEGMVAKGLLFNAPIEIYPIISGALAPAPIGSGRTNTAGRYSVDLSNYDGTPLLVRVAADANTTMRCDLADGCGGNTSFGDTVAFTDPQFQLDALVSSSPGGAAPVAINVSVLTDIVSRHALRVASAAVDFNQLIRESDAMVANRFGLPNNLISHPILDITNAGALASADESILRYNLINSAIIGSLLEDGAPSLAGALVAFRAQYASGGGIADTETNDSALITLEEIFAKMLALCDRIEAADIAGVLNLGPLTTELQANRIAARFGSLVPSRGVASSPAASGLEKAKAMMAEVRKLATGIEHGFEAEAQLVEAALDQDAAGLFRAVAMSAQAIGAAWNARHDNPSLASFEHNETGLTVTISGNTEATTYTVADDAVGTAGEDSVVVNFSAVDTDSNLTEETAQGTKTGSARVDLNLSGSAASSNLLLDVAAGSLVLEGMQATATGGADSKVVVGQFERLDLSLEVLLEESARANNPITFDGSLSLSIAEADGRTALGSSGSTSVEEELTIEKLNVSLSGNFSAASGETLFGSIFLALVGDDTPLTHNETADDYVAANFAAILRLSGLGEIKAPTQLTLSGARTGLQSALGSVRVVYGAVNLSSQYHYQSDGSTPTEVVIRDQNGVVLTLNETADKFGGSVMVNGTRYATINEVNGLPRIAYTDGANESLW